MSDTDQNIPHQTPKGSTLPVDLAAGLLVVYAVAVVLNALRVHGELGSEGLGLARAAVRCAGVGLVAWGLWRRARWAWWIGVIMAGLLCLTGSLAIAILRVTPDTSAVNSSAALTPFLYIYVVLMGAVAVLLLLPSSRAAFRAGGR
jgi:hypothetical protein